MHQTTALSLNGIVHHRGQDTNGWPQGYTLGEQPLDFGYDLAGRITGLDQNGTAYDQSFGYDAADRLTSYTGFPAPRAYTYDANGNRTSETLGAMITSITHVAGTNRIHKVGTQAMVFDAAGNLTSYAGKSFTHGGDGRLRTTTTGAGTVTYQYDGFDRRVSKSGPATLVPGGFVRYAYDAAHHLVGEYKADGSPIKEYVWIGDLPVAVIETHPDSTTTAYAIETDHLGTPRLLTDATRAPRWRWTSPPFGEVLPEDDPSGLGAVTFNLRFPGQYYDKETGLHYNFNRYYDPGTGRYVQSDPIGLNGGWNTYGYVGGNPLMFVDPLGLASSGQTTQIPGGSPTTVRIDPPHVPGQQTHAHICEKGCKEIVVNKDRTGSHNTDPSKLKNRVKNFLRARGFKLMWCPPFLEDLVMGMAAQQCSEGDLGACQIFQQMGGTILSDSLGGDI